MSNQELLQLAVNAVDDKKAEQVVALNMKGISLIADFFLICHGNSEKQVQAIAHELKKVAQEQGIEIKRLEGYEQARWVLIDLGDVVVHVFHKDERAYYNLEKLWGDAPTVELEGVIS
ncbi:ribosome silencing factor [Halalkalibacterium halodurans]|jgi:ribosome-associated protein|uniref:Ribosomal silencing factor RsfS n=3 Tax=Halalkalibacterium halodurans TaxID=86665 RepID=IOJAP_HALH5|nr:ribosome silencing factor [Halalkalibacterium halodurans]Q9KD89.1 RecName: Full=Ribosomal silencing factor RsfS [Halalkalibacterium halodurans C-125]MDY7221855.1 ribosome silencing factor [Halalkalibacterium halodurans]MDY7241131.1 ribosome silencing factor [Halalkalibacterium halodurans]MED4080563.1 ribosome silencing factor [Halalkalibacterium halodurans]MED4083815.1 ribosome silencing factor [Halalkalibacterium halodurans]MED4105452.1 ribosome silencing factor [Halalkalibacterium halodu